MIKSDVMATGSLFDADNAAQPCWLRRRQPINDRRSSFIYDTDQ